MFNEAETRRIKEEPWAFSLPITLTRNGSAYVINESYILARGILPSEGRVTPVVRIGYPVETVLGRDDPASLGGIRWYEPTQKVPDIKYRVTGERMRTSFSRYIADKFKIDLTDGLLALNIKVSSKSPISTRRIPGDSDFIQELERINKNA